MNCSTPGVAFLPRASFFPLSPPWKYNRTATIKDDIQKVVVTHPFSPHRGKEYYVIDKIPNWDMLLCRDNDGDIHTFLSTWTNYTPNEPVNPFIGSIDFLFEDLQLLERLLSNIKKDVT